MRVAYSSPIYLPALNGTSVYVSQLSKEFDSEVFTSDAFDWISFHSKKGKVINKKEKRVHRSKIVHIPGISSIPYYKIHSMRKILSKFGSLEFFLNGPFCPSMLFQLLKAKFDVIHSVTLPYLNNYLSLIASKIKRKPLVCTPFFIPQSERYQREAYYNFLKKCSAVLCCTNYEMNFLKSKGVKNLYKVPMFVDFGEFSSYSGIYKKLGRFVLFVGNKSFEKGAYDLIDAIPFVVEKFKDVKFVFVGPSTIGFKLKKKRSKFRRNIIDLGILKGKHKVEIFNCCEIFAMPSSIDAFGIAYLEAMACGKPVIAAEREQSKEIIENGKNGFLVKFNSPKELADRIIYLLENERERIEMGNRGREIVKEKYDRKIVVPMIREIYLKVS